MEIYKNMTNVEIADLLRAVSAAYEIQGKKENRFKIIAYGRAADAVEHSSSEIKDLWDDGKLEQLAGVGPSIAQHLGEIFTTGKSKHFDEVMGDIPQAVFELIKIPGIGPSRAATLVRALKISSKSPYDDLKKAAEEGRVAKLEGFGEDSQAAIMKSLEEYKGRDKDRMMLNYAEGRATEVVEWMGQCPEVERVDTLGSLRRKASTVGDIDIAVATDKPKAVLEHFVNFPKKVRILEKGEKTASIIIPGNLQIDLMVGPVSQYGALLQHFTGSKHHNIALREFANKKGWSLSEYGIRKFEARSTKSETNSKLKKFKTEEEFYKFLGLEYIPPELREDMGEIEAAQRKAVPSLVELKDIKADLQIHTNFDIETSHDLGESSMEEILDKALALGYEYVAFTDHNPSHSRHSKKQIIELIKRRGEKIKVIRHKVKAFNSLEVDIMPDGSLPVPEEGLELLDFALVSIHSSFNQSRKEATERVLRAFDNPKVKIFAHPTGRKINEREGVEFEWPKIFEVCKKRNIWLEVNASPSRLDLPDYLVKEAVDAGVKLTMGTDAHHAGDMGNMIYAVYTARRGWAQKNDIINARSLKDFEKFLISN